MQTFTSQRSFRLQVLVDLNPLDVEEKDGKYYLAAPIGKEYELLVVVPNDGKRYEAVLSVDGLSVMTGERASSYDRGYVVSAGSPPIPGFRLNHDEVAHFEFRQPGESYAALTDKAENIGVIGLKIFSEYVPELEIVEKTRESFRLERSVSKRGETRGHDVGTGFGRRTESRVSSTEFQRASCLVTIVLEYASRESLIEAGIIRNLLSPLGDVKAFPADPGCTPPPGWVG